jgi:hypothetical protein
MACVLAAVSIGVGAQGAAAAPSSSAGAKIAAIVSSTKFAATYLQHAPNSLRQLAADAILFESVFLLAPHPAHHAGLHFAARHAAVAHTAAIPIPGTVVGGLDLNSYCQSLGFAYSMVIGNVQIAPGAAYNWVCVTAPGAQTPIVMQAACLFQYPGAEGSSVLGAWSRLLVGRLARPGRGESTRAASDTRTRGRRGSQGRVRIDGDAEYRCHGSVSWVSSFSDGFPHTARCGGARACGHDAVLARPHPPRPFRVVGCAISRHPRAQGGPGQLLGTASTLRFHAPAPLPITPSQRSVVGGQHAPVGPPRARSSYRRVSRRRPLL